MKIVVNQVDPKGNDYEDRIKTSYFITLLMKFCFIPITFAPEMIVLRFCSWKIIVHLLPIIYHALCIIYLFPFVFDFDIYFGPKMDYTNSMTLLSEFCISFLGFLSKPTLLILSCGLKFMKPRRLIKENQLKYCVKVKYILGKYI